MEKKYIIIYTSCFVVVCVILVGLYYYMTHRIDYSAIDYIKGFMKGKFVYNDMAEDIAVHDMNDLGYKINGKYDIVLYYGGQVIHINKQCFESDEFLQRLKQIGVTLKWREDDEGYVQYRLEYFGEEIQEWDVVASLDGFMSKPIWVHSYC